jgi:hypothetical protein
VIDLGVALSSGKLTLLPQSLLERSDENMAVITGPVDAITCTSVNLHGRGLDHVHVCLSDTFTKNTTNATSWKDDTPRGNFN